MRTLGIDIGLRRVGLALSDPSGTLATPWRTVLLEPGDEALDLVLRVIDELARADEPVDRVVVGLPRRLDGSETEMTPRAKDLARDLADRSSLPVVLQDERLTSREADSRLAVGERDWRRRKARLDAASAAIILQDYLDRVPAGGTLRRGPIVH
jgi:putative Holliday junction resolvase